MGKKFAILTLLVFFLGFGFQLLAQFTPEELAERPKWEEFLKTAKVIKSEKIGEGVTKPRRLYLRKDNIEASGVWKSPGGGDAGLFDKWQCEIAAYRMDKLLGLNMVPPTVQKSFRGRRGSIQLFVELEISELDRRKQNIPIPPDKTDHCEKVIYLARAFDSLIANTDRTQQNIRFTKDWCLILIDHSRSFRWSNIYLDKLIYGKYGQRSHMRFLKLPRDFVRKVRALTYDSIRQAVGRYLAKHEIEAVLTRKKLLIKEIDEMIEERGIEEVLY